MQMRIPATQKTQDLIKIRRTVNGSEKNNLGAFALSNNLEISLDISRKLGVCLASLIIFGDAEKTTSSYPLEYTKTVGSADTYTVTLCLKELCKERDFGLFYFYFTLNIGNDILYLSSVNNIDFEVVSDLEHLKSFRLLVYSDSYSTPSWAKSAVMYHIFVDRFAKSDRKTPKRDDCVINENWSTGIPKFAEYPGAPLDNNEFFGGSLYGITEKLPYLHGLGINCIYLSPVFKAYSNHKYDTGRYDIIDEMFGGEDAFAELLRESEKLGIRIILDGVFNHTGDDSLYFNKYGKYDSEGAYQSYTSPYRDWYFFKNFPDDYESWWGIKILPKLNTNCPSLRNYLLSNDGIVRKYLSQGISGWRLDVADELPDSFLTELRSAAKTEKKDSLIIGEVWENAADKIAYSERRHYFSGHQLDSVMNYPVKNSIIKYVKDADSESFYNELTDIYSSYPPESSAVLMNILGTHDTERILTVLGTDTGANLSNAEKAHFRLSDSQRAAASELLKIASILQFTLPGMPSVFYGDEAGVEGFGDPFCRKPYPWGTEDTEIREHYAKLCKIKRTETALSSGNINFVCRENGVIGFERFSGKEKILVYVNMSNENYNLNTSGNWTKIFGNAQFCDSGFVLYPKNTLVLKKMS